MNNSAILQKLLLTFVMALSSSLLSLAQNVGINATGATPADCSMLDIVSTTKGLLIPRVALTDVTAWAPLTGTAVDGVIVYSTTAPTGGGGTGYYYWSTVVTAHWVNLLDNLNPGTPWLTFGNTGLTSPAVPVTYGTSTIGATENWMGHTDAKDIVFGTDTKERMRIMKTSGFVGIGTAAPSTLFHIDGGTGSTTQTIATITGNSLTSGTGLLVTTNQLVSGNLLDVQATNAGSYTGNGIRATISGTSGASYAIYGITASTTGRGTYGNATSTTGVNFGAYGRTASNDGFGIVGLHASTTAATNASFADRVAGVYGETDADNTIGVIGITKTHSVSQSVGVWGFGSSYSADIGVMGIGNAQTYTALAAGAGAYFIGSTYGTYSRATATTGTGVVGVANNTTGNPATTNGVYGYVSSVNGIGVWGDCATGVGANGGAGVYGFSGQSNGAGVWGVGSDFVASGTGACGVYGSAYNKNALNAGVYGQNANNTSGTSWLPTQVTAGVAGRTTGTATYAAGVYGYNNNSAVNNNAALFGQDGQAAFAGIVYTYTPSATQRTMCLYGQTSGDVNDRCVEGVWSSAAASPWGYIGGTDLGLFGSNPGTTAGTAYNATVNGISGETGGGAYNFAIQGYDLGSTARSGGIIGNYSSTVWGALGYKASSAITYGGYFTTTTTGAGFLPSGSFTGIGSGNYGGIIGSWTRGDVMGHVSSGELFASYNLGNEYTSGYQAEIVTLANKRVATYSVTSTDVKIYNDGTSQLSMGKTRVNFDESFSELIADNAPTVTISPMGQCNGIYISNVDSKGFDVIELNNGNSNAVFSYIVIGKRIDAANKPELPADLAKKDFDEKMKGVMFNENNLDRSATPIWWDGKSIRFENLPDDSAKKKEESDKIRHHK